MSSFERVPPAGGLRSEEHPITRMFYERLDPGVVEEVRRRMGEDPEVGRMGFEKAEPDVWQFVALSYGMWWGIDGVAAQTGLIPDQPPDDVHAMARGPLAAAGGLHDGDLVVSALRSAGVDVRQLGAGLDFGCSSGRVVRLLAAAYPQVRWIGCDPNEGAIAWARAHLPGGEFFCSGGEPPLQLDEASLDLAFAISVWSHFEPTLGLRWFDEMRRVIRAGGHLIMTTHGLTSIAYADERKQRSREQLKEILAALYRAGSWYAPEFGEQGDWGVRDPGWGTAFLGPEWVLATLCPRWRVLEFAPGRLQGNQDVYVLERV